MLGSAPAVPSHGVATTGAAHLSGRYEECLRDLTGILGLDSGSATRRRLAR
ncbi:hypothetical protein [Nocardia sp. NPDC003345]